MELVQPKHSVQAAAIAAGPNEINVAVAIDVRRNEGVKHASLPAGNIVTVPGLCGVLRILEPGNPPDGIRDGHFLAVFFVWPKAVASGDHVGTFVGVDIGNRYSRGMIWSDRTNVVHRPGLRGVAGLLEPEYRSLWFQGDSDDIQAAVSAEIKEVEVES